MTAEANLYEALVIFLAARGKRLATGGADDLIIPVLGGEQLQVPVLFLLPTGAPSHS